MNFEGKNVLVTGGGSGIGRATALEFARAGAAVMIVDIDEAGAGRTADEARGLGRTAHVRQVDVADQAAVAALFAGLADVMDALDVAVNCAGVAEGEAPFEDVDFARFRRTMAVNVEGMFHCMQGEIRAMKRQGHGAIVNVASQQAHEALPDMTAYTTSKHAVLGLTKTAALELARHNVRVNAVSPGVVETELFQRYFEGRDDDRAALLASLPLGRPLRPREVARAILFLASPDAAQFIGQSLRLDGGGADVKPSTAWTYSSRLAAFAA